MASDPFTAARRAGGGVAAQAWGNPSGGTAAAAWGQSPASSLPSVGSMGQIGGDIAAPVTMTPAAPAAAFARPAHVPSSAPSDPTSAFSDLTSNPVAAIAMQQGKQLVQSGIARYLPGALALWESLHYYFQVNNSYVKAKLQRLLFPWRASSLKRQQAPASDDFAPPAEDINAPDLYIPLMAFVTYVLSMGLLKGIGMKFHPEVLGQVMSATLVIVILEVVLVRSALYLLNVSGARLLDLVAFSGYKYVGLVVNLLVGMFLGRTGYYVALLYTGACMFVFMLRTLKPIVVPGPDDAGQSGGKSRIASSPHNLAILGISAFQLVLMWWMGSSGETA